jgi:hypothetical protein
MTAATCTAPARQWRLRFTLRIVLATITILCVWLAIHTQRARMQQRIVRQVRSNFGRVYYDYQMCGGTPRDFASPIHPTLIKLLGEDFFHTVVEVHVRGDSSVLAELHSLWWLNRLGILKESLTDEELAPIAELKSLRSLAIQSDQHNSTDYPDTTRIGDRSLALIGQMPALEEAYIEGYQFTAEGLAALARSPSLRSVYVGVCDASVDTQVAEPFLQAGRVKSLRIRRYVPGKSDGFVVDI